MRRAAQAYLPEIGLNYYKARIYSPTLSRFMQSDPIGYGDGVNFYDYVGGDPVNNVDPTGLAQNSENSDDDLKGDDIVVNAGRGGSVSVGGGSSRPSVNFLNGGPGVLGNGGSCNTSCMLNALLNPAGEEAISTEVMVPIKAPANIKGERNRTAKPSGTANPFKKIKQHPTKPGWVQHKDQNGKTKERPGTPDELVHLANKSGPVADISRTFIPFWTAVGMRLLAPSTCTIADKNGDSRLDKSDLENY